MYHTSHPDYGDIGIPRGKSGVYLIQKCFGFVEVRRIRYVSYKY
jgi:hypothetical protein